MNRIVQASRHVQGGLALIEMALILPIFLVVVFGTINFTIGLYNQAILTNASREAARAGIAFRVPAPTHTDIIDAAMTYCEDHLITFGTHVPPEVIVEEPRGRLPGEPLRVTVRYQFKGLDVFSGLSPGTLAATATMLFE